MPDDARTEDLADITEWLGETVRQTDSSLLDEWERLRSPGDVAAVSASRGRPADDRPPPVTANARAFRALVRNALFHRVELAALRRYYDLGELDAEAGWDADAWQAALAPYWEEHAFIGTDADARGPQMLLVDDSADPRRWVVRQILADPVGDHDWGISAAVDLDASDDAGEAVVAVTSVGPL